MPHRDVALTLVAARHVPPGPASALHAVLDRLGPSVFAGLLDPKGVVQYANHAALRAIGSTPEQVLGRRFDATPWWQGCELSKRRLQQALASAARGQASRFDVRVATSRGTTLSMDFSLLPVHGPDGRIASLIASACDVSEREWAHRDKLEHLVRERTAELRAAKEKAELANDAKSSFLASMSHDLRSPLNAILGFAQLLHRGDGLNGRQQQAIQLIRHSGEHLLTLVNDLLDLAKIEAGRFEILPADFEPDPFFQTVAGMVRVRAEQKADLEFVCDLPAEWPPTIRADQTRLRQVLINLLDNAVKFTGRGRVTLRASFQARSRLRLEIEDTGVAIGEAQLARLFRPFEQAGNAQQRALGTGLGLVISQRFVRLMGSEIVVESRPGVGNLFWFELDVGTPCIPPSGSVAC